MKFEPRLNVLAALCLVAGLISSPCQAQQIEPALLSAPWKAMWITGPGAAGNNFAGVSLQSNTGYAVYKFRKTFSLSEKPGSFIVHVSADNRYKLYVNGNLVSLGPARGDLFHWNFETVDIAGHLKAGDNQIAALVWNEGPARPEAQITLMTAFIIQGNSTAEQVVNSNDTWKVVRDDAYEPLTPRVTGYYVAGPGELIRMKSFVCGWELAGFDDGSWPAAKHVVPGIPKGVFTFSPITWMLVPSMLPQMELSMQRMNSVRTAKGITPPSTFPREKAAVTIPANTRAELLIDNSVLTNAYPTLAFSGGRDAGISLGYAEALYIRKDENISGRWIPTLPKGNRNDVDGKTFIGRLDSIISDGTKGQSFTSLWYRTYRYVLLRVETKTDPLVIDDMYGTFTGYPLQLAASLQSGDPSIQKNLEIGWRTARLCATETYMDCPYYEQLQYFGDTRIQALVTLFNTRDDRLVRQAIIQGDRSRIAEGVTMSRYPTASTQIIPPFSLWWIGMVHDYWMYRDNEAFVRSMLPGTRQVLNFFNGFQDKDGSMRGLPYWIFTDWVRGYGWKDGVAPLGKDGSSCVLDIQLFWTYRIAASMERTLGLKDLASDYDRRADQLAATIKAKYWDASRKLFADTPEKDLFSEHPNALAILSGIVTGTEATELARSIMSGQGLAPASIYFKYYLHLAYLKAGFGNDYIKWLGKWNENIALGLTTWAEMSDVAASRSDCHAWGSSPNIEFYRTVLGVDSGAPGFRKVRIEPHPAGLKKLSGTVPHPAGDIVVTYTFEKKGKVDITLPAGIDGEFVWGGKSTALQSGRNQLTFINENEVQRN